MNLQNNLSEEMSGADFGDRRLSKRLKKIVGQLSEDPARGFPIACGCDSSLEGLYRFLGNERVSPGRILEPHFVSTCHRLEGVRFALAIHDTSTFIFSAFSERDDLQRYSKFKQGFLGHFALCVTEKGNYPLGLLGMDVGFRGKGKKEKESRRWFNLVLEAEQRNQKRATLIHVMDREADTNYNFDTFIENGFHFVVRVRTARLVNLNELTKFFEKGVYVSTRRDPGCPQERQYHPERESRVANLSFYAGTVTVLGQLVNVVYAVETKPPKDEKPVEWVLFTSEGVNSVEQVTRVVEIYKKRWLIEEFFKALKTGCSYEQRQLESKKTLTNALAVFSPIAIQMLLLRALSRTKERIPLQVVFTKSQIAVLRRFSEAKLPKRLGTQSMFAAIATMGGHLKSNGPAGWMVLWRGFNKLMTLESAWTAALRGCDQ
jgi:hypothetical protein